MATSIIRNQKILFGGYDLTGQTNSLALEYGCDTLERTVLNDDTHNFTSGLFNITAGASGFFDPATDKILFDGTGVDGRLLTYAQSLTTGSVAHFFQSMVSNFESGGSVGELMTYNLSAGAQGKLLRGVVGGNVVDAASNGNGTAINLGGVAAGKKVYAGVHVTKAGGTTPALTLTLKSDATNAFSGAETTRITFSGVNAVGSDLKELPGAITDGWWRFNWAITGTSPQFSFVPVIAIL
jgi:hypothetical protein